MNRLIWVSVAGGLLLSVACSSGPKTWAGDQPVSGRAGVESTVTNEGDPGELSGGARRTDDREAGAPDEHANERDCELGEGTDAQFEESLKACRPSGAHAGQDAYASDPHVERVPDWAAITDWWPYRPLFRSVDLPRRGAEEVLYVGGRLKRGRQHDPQTMFTHVSILYEFPPSVSASGSYWDVLDGGGVSVRTYFRPRGEQPPFQGLGLRRVTVRGHVAEVFEIFREDGSNADWRAIMWYEATDNGGTIEWDFGTNPTIYSEQEAISMIEALIEVR